jgi:hypothetical protein
MKPFNGSDEYWENVIAARQGWPQKKPSKADPDSVRASETAAVPPAPEVRDTGAVAVGVARAPLKEGVSHVGTR